MSRQEAVGVDPAGRGRAAEPVHAGPQLDPATRDAIARRRRANWLRAAAAALAVGGLVVVYPLVLEVLLARVGVRPAAAGSLLLVGASALLPRRAAAAAPPGVAQAMRVLPLGLGLLLALAFATERLLFLRMVPAAVYLALAAACAASLRAPDSLIERLARFMVPELPDFVRGYCRKVTALWALFFALAAAMIAVLAWVAGPVVWRRAAGSGLYSAMAVLTFVEFLVRKTWFRHYFHGGPIDRLWSRLFPAERTPQGRRSLAYIARYREQQAAAARQRDAH